MTSFSDKSELDISLYLQENGFDLNVCQVFEDQEIDGESFLELSMDELNSLFPKKLGTVKKLYRLIQSELSKNKTEAPNVSSPLSTSLSSPMTSTPVVSPGSSSLSQNSTPVHPTQPKNQDSISVCSSSSASGSIEDAKKKFSLPDTWRPAIMAAIEEEEDSKKRKKLTPDLRNAIVRDLVSTMYAHMSQPNKKFCTHVARELVHKYPFMKDIGSNVTGYGSWEKKIVERVHNVSQYGKRKLDLEEGSSKKGRPKIVDDILTRYPPMQYSMGDIDEDKIKALKKELEKEKPRKDTVLQLFKQTFSERRQYVLSTQVSVAQLVEKYKGFKLQYTAEQEIDSILKKKDVIKTVAEDWSAKWTPAIIKYAESLKSKAVKTAIKSAESMFLGDEEDDEKKALYLLVVVLLKNDANDNFNRIYEDHILSEDPDFVARKATVSTPLIAYFHEVDGQMEYYLIVEKQVLLRGISSFSKSLALWFSLHYIFNLEYHKSTYELALFLQEFVFGLPAIKAKKSSTYLSVSSDIQTFTISY